MVAFIAKYLSGLWGYVAAAGVAAFLAVGATHWIDALTYGHTIDGLTVTVANLKTATANEHAADASQTLATLQNWVARNASADNQYNSDMASIRAQFAALKAEFASATKIPLPVDCKPDIGRLRVLSAAVAATSPTAATGPAK